MKHSFVHINKYIIDIDYSVEKDLKSFKEEMLDFVSDFYSKHKDFTLLFSGGMDSTFLLRTLKELNIPVKTLTVSFSENNDDYDCEMVKAKCKKYGVDNHRFVYLEKDSFFEHMRIDVLEKKKVFPVLHGHIIQYLLDMFPDEVFFTGLGSEFKLKNGKIFMPPGPQILKDKNPERVYGFATSRTFLSYINHPIFKEKYKENNEYVWHVRDLIYTDCFPDIEIELKRPANSDYIANIYNNILHQKIMCENPLPFILDNYEFDVEEYFKNKANIQNNVDNQ